MKKFVVVLTGWTCLIAVCNSQTGRFQFRKSWNREQDELKKARMLLGERIQHPDTFLKYYNQINFRDGLQKNPELIGGLSLKAGNAYLDKNQIDSAIQLLDIALKHYVRINRPVECGKVENLLGICWEKKSLYNLAVSHYYHALILFQQAGDRKGIANGRINIGLIRYAQHRYSEAESLFKEALILGGQLNDLEICASAISNLGMLYQTQNHYSKALMNFKEVLRLDSILGNDYNGGTYNNLGVVYFHLNRFDSSNYYYQKAVEEKISMGDSIGLVNTYANLTELYIQMGKLDLAAVYLSKQESITNTFIDPGLKATYYQLLSLYWERKGDSRKAFELYKKYRTLSDSIDESNMADRSDQFEQIFQNYKLNRELEVKSQELDRDRQFYDVICVLTVMLTLAILYLIFLVSRIRKKNKALLLKNAEVENAIRLSEEAAAAKSRFLSTMSHEIRTPINSIIGVTRLLEFNQPRDDQKQNLQILQIASENLLHLVNDILDYNKLEAGKMRFLHKPFRLRETINKLYKLFQYRMEEKQLNFEVHYDSNIPSVLLGDESRITQILINLAGNAYKFTQTGFVYISVNLEEDLDRIARIRFSVKDSGMGIAPENQKMIFEGFSQVESTFSRKFEGTGLGLAICKSLLQQAGSDLQLYSVLGEGSEFYFYLNLEKVYNSEGLSHDHSGFKDDTLNSNSLQDKQILVVDDNLINLQIIKQFLVKWGAVCQTAGSGKEALEFCQNRQFDIIILDLNMPDMDGIETAVAIRKDRPLNAHTPLIALTALQESDIPEHIYEVGFNDSMTKPFEPSRLLRTLEVWI